MTVYEENIRRDHPTLPNFIDVLSKTECIFFLALDTHVYTYKYTLIFLLPLPLFEFAEILLNRWGKDIANCSSQVESNRWSRNRQRKTKASGRKPIEKVAT